MMKYDLHDFTLESAKTYIGETIKRATKNKISRIEFIHGYNNGQKIKNYLRGKKILVDNPDILKVEPALLNSGSTYVYLKVTTK